MEEVLTMYKSVQATSIKVSAMVWPIDFDTPTQAKDDNSHFLKEMFYVKDKIVSWRKIKNKDRGKAYG